LAAKHPPAPVATNVDAGRASVGLEICVDDLGGVSTAVAGGADRIELCSALMVGGLTPSVPLTRLAIDVARPAGVDVHAMVRPRGGDFTYCGTEMMLAAEEARSLIATGVDGLVFGAVRDSRLDEQALCSWVDAVRRKSATVRLTLHRAIDVVDDPVAAVNVALRLGFDRILTSGGAANAAVGAATIARMVAQAADRCRIMGGGGLSSENAAIVLAAGVHDLHGSASRSGAHLPDAFTALRVLPPRYTDIERVRALREIVDGRHAGLVRRADFLALEPPAGS